MIVTPLHPLPRFSAWLGGVEIWIKRDGFLAFGDGFIMAVHDSVGPTEVSMGLGRGEGGDRAPIEGDGVTQLAMLLVAVGAVSQNERLFAHEVLFFHYGH